MHKRPLFDGEKIYDKQIKCNVKYVGSKRRNNLCFIVMHSARHKCENLPKAMVNSASRIVR